MSLKIYHNPRCGKSRQTLAIIQEAGQHVEIIEYLKNVPTFDELKEIISKLGIPPLELIRKKEAVFVENYKGHTHTDNEWINIMLENPILIERPIVIMDDRAVLGRPPENVLTLLR